MNRREFIQLSLTSTAAVSGSLLVSPAAATGTTLKLRDLYNKDLSFSDTAKAAAGKPIAITGFMAPPLKAQASFFVLTKQPMSVCPFCESAADWPDNILAVYTKRTVKVEPFNVKLLVRGTLELGSFTDPDTGFVSLVRLGNAEYDRH